MGGKLPIESIVECAATARGALELLHNRSSHGSGTAESIRSYGQLLCAMPNSTPRIGPKFGAFLWLAGGIALAIPFARGPSDPSSSEPVLFSKSTTPMEHDPARGTPPTRSERVQSSVVRGTPGDRSQPSKAPTTNASEGFATIEPNRSTEGSSGRSAFDPQFDSRSEMGDPTGRPAVPPIRPPGSQPSESVADDPSNEPPRIVGDELPATRATSPPPRNSSTPRLPDWAKPQSSLDELIAAGPVEAGDDDSLNGDPGSVDDRSRRRIFQPMGHERRLEAAAVSRLQPFQTWGPDAEPMRLRSRKTSEEAESIAGIDSSASDPASSWDPQQMWGDEQRSVDEAPSQLASQRIVKWPDKALRIDWERIAQREQTPAPEVVPQRGSYGASLARHEASRYAVSGDGRGSMAADRSWTHRENSDEADGNVIYRPGMRRD